ncbi:hypothetical protein H4582DRAFT_2095709 [Lactarius indigo]|nr:hypothetical protein H4582DRAFT_2095709 [Lactarius indigo]
MDIFLRVGLLLAKSAPRCKHEAGKAKLARPVYTEYYVCVCMYMIVAIKAGGIFSEHHRKPKPRVEVIKLFIGDDSADLPSSNVDVPWTIKNKYYSADVALAPRRPLVVPDSFLADHGFGYIGGERTRHLKSDDDRPDTVTDTGTVEDDEDPVPGLLRITDALSTIMWPSMVRRGHDDGDCVRKGQAAPFDFDALHTNEEGEEETLAAFMEVDAADSGATLIRTIRTQREMATLERWLVEGEEMHESELAEPRLASMTTATYPGFPARGGVTPGFDDDFSAFVSPPAVSVSPAVATAGVCVCDCVCVRVHPRCHPYAWASRYRLAVPMLLPSHTGSSSYRRRSRGLGGAGRSPFFFSPEHEFEDADADARTPVGRGERVGLTDARAAFDLADTLASLQTMREDVFM